jgi:uncharacterized protein (UPF0276 family)
MIVDAHIPKVGIGFRPEASDDTIRHLNEFETLEVIVDHYIGGGFRLREQLIDLGRRVPLVGHGVCLSLATGVLPDRFYLDQVAEALNAVGAPSHSEHLAFTKVPGRDPAELLPVPRTREVADIILRNLEIVHQHINLPLTLENITYYFEYPGAEMSEPEFLELICREGKTNLLLDVENLYLNSCNHHYDPYEYIDALPAGLVQGVHVAGGIKIGRLMIDSHNKRIPEPVLGLLEYLLARQNPQTIVLERDDDLDRFDEILADVQRLKTIVSRSRQLSYENSGTA